MLNKEYDHSMFEVINYSALFDSKEKGYQVSSGSRTCSLLNIRRTCLFLYSTATWQFECSTVWVKFGRASEDLVPVKSKEPVAVAEFGEPPPPVFCCGFPWTNDTVAAVSRASVLTKTHGARLSHRTRARLWPSQRRGFCSCAASFFLEGNKWSSNVSTAAKREIIRSMLMLLIFLEAYKPRY
jgi:hypothetical protein